MPTFHKDAIRDVGKKVEKNHPLVTFISVATVLFLAWVLWPAISVVARGAWAIINFVFTVGVGGGIIVGVALLCFWSLGKTFKRK